MNATLPPRRINRTVTIEWNGSRFEVTYGFDKSGMCREMFVSSPLSGSLLGVTYANDAIMVSRLLDDLGLRAAKLLEALSAEPETLTVVALAKAVEIEETDGPMICEEYAAIDTLARYASGGVEWLSHTGARG